MKTRWTAPALRDLEAIGDFIARNDPFAAQRIVSSIFSQTESLIDYPRRGRPGRIDGTRELVITATPFIVPYRAREDIIEVLAVFHGARRWPDSFD